MIERLGVTAPGIDPTRVDGADAIEHAGLAAETDGVDGIDGIDRIGGEEAAGATLDLERLLAGPSPAHRERALDLGGITHALTRVASQPSPAEPPAVTRMREVVARYLALRLEVAEGVARIAIG